MVDALRRATRWLRPDGCVIDIHPTPLPSTIEVDGVTVGRVQTTDGPERHAAADAAVAAVVRDGLFTVAGSAVFDFYTCADTLDELREYIEDNWRDARVFAGATAGRPRSHEQVRITKLWLARGRQSA
jgi:hypothetical protein